MCPAPKGNKFALGNSGKPKMWKSVEDLQKDIDAYFEWCDQNPLQQVHNSRIDKETGKPLVFNIARPYTIEGLCSFLECNRDTLINYERQAGYEEYFDTIKKAKNKIQQNKVERALSGLGHATVTIFDLKNNHGYKDRFEHDMKDDRKVSDLSKLSDKELLEYKQLTNKIKDGEVESD